jgi:hypothetical protein
VARSQDQIDSDLILALLAAAKAEGVEISAQEPPDPRKTLAAGQRLLRDNPELVHELVDSYKRLYPSSGTDEALPDTAYLSIWLAEHVEDLH